jgi:hypothetical protein
LSTNTQPVLCAVNIKLDILEFLCRYVFAVGRGFRDGIVCAEDFERFAAACGSVLVALLELVVPFFFLLLTLALLVIRDRIDCVMFEGGGCVLACACRRVVSVPGVGDDDVVEGRVTLAEARETDFENHGSKIFMYCSVSRVVICPKGSLSRRLSGAAAAKDDFHNEGTNAKNWRFLVVTAAKTINVHFTPLSFTFLSLFAFHSHFPPFTSNSLSHMINSWVR